MSAINRTASASGTIAGFSGVALADILANGVSIILILIVVSLVARYEQEQMKLEQTEDVSVLLSRELASSFVMNALPTSPPAVLHDYLTSPQDINPRHEVMPIIELRKGFIRDFYTGRVWPRAELLKQDNDFDAYLNSLVPEQLLALRIDVYAVTEFYITMSILKQHNHQPRHWHFLEGNLGGGGLSVLAGGTGVNNGSGTADDTAGEGDAEEPKGLAGPLPEDVSLAGAGVGGGYSYGGSQNPAFGAESRGMLDLPGMGQESGSGGEPSMETAGDGEGSGREQVRFRSAAPEVAMESSLMDMLEGADLFDLIRALYVFMERIQEDADNNLPSVLHEFDFVKQVLALVPTLPPLNNAAAIREAEELTRWMDRFDSSEEDGLALQVTDQAAVPGIVVALSANQRLQRVEVLRDAFQPAVKGLPETVRLGMRLGLHSEIHQGVHAPIARDGVLMMPRVSPDPNYKWRVVTLVDAELSDFITGFVYAAVDEAGRLLLPADVNAVGLNGRRLQPHLPALEYRSERWWLLFFSIGMLLVALGWSGRRVLQRGVATEKGVQAS